MLKKSLCLLGLVGMLTGCGQDGPLFLPAKNTSSQPASQAIAAKSQASSAPAQSSSDLSQPVIPKRPVVPTGPPSAY